MCDDHGHISSKLYSKVEVCSKKKDGSAGGAFGKASGVEWSAQGRVSLCGARKRLSSISMISGSPEGMCHVCVRERECVCVRQRVCVCMCVCVCVCV